MIVYLDVIGFTTRVENAASSQSETRKIKKTLQRAHKLILNINKYPIIPDPNLKARMFSDTVVLTCQDPDYFAVTAMITAAAILQVVMIQDNFFLRGSAVIGNHYMKDDVDFGPAIIRAERMEKLAFWPRVVVDSSVIHKVDPLSDERARQVIEESSLALEAMSGHIAEDRLLLIPSPIPDLKALQRATWQYMKSFFNKAFEDGLKFIDYLALIFRTWTVLKWSLEYRGKKIPDYLERDLFSTHKNAILNAITPRDIVITTDVLTKFHCLAEYHNSVIADFYRLFPRTFSTAKFTSDKRLARLYATLVTLLAVELPKMPTKERAELVITKLEELSKKRDELRSHRIELPKAFKALY